MHRQPTKNAGFSAYGEAATDKGDVTSSVNSRHCELSVLLSIFLYLEETEPSCSVLSLRRWRKR